MKKNTSPNKNDTETKLKLSRMTVAELSQVVGGSPVPTDKWTKTTRICD